MFRYAVLYLENEKRSDQLTAAQWNITIYFDVKGWRPKIDRDIFQEPKNSPKFGYSQFFEF